MSQNDFCNEMINFIHFSICFDKFIHKSNIALKEAKKTFSTNNEKKFAELNFNNEMELNNNVLYEGSFTKIQEIKTTLNIDLKNSNHENLLVDKKAKNYYSK